jgi:hypothetical protein
MVLLGLALERFRHERVGSHGLEAQVSDAALNRPLFAGGSKVSMDGAYGKK